MANIEHSTLTTTNLHENKGVSSAADDTVATATGGATVWKKLTAANLSGIANPFGAQLFHVRDEKAAGTPGGTFNSGAFRTRTLQTTKTNEIASASLAANQISLPAGTYFVQARATANKVDAHQIRFRNITAGTTTVVGSNTTAAVSSLTQNDSVLYQRFTIAGTSTFELQHICQTSKPTDGFGLALGNELEIYAEVLIWKVA